VTELRSIGVNAVFLEPRMGGLQTYVLRLLPELMALRPDLRVTVFANREGGQFLKQSDWSADAEILTLPILGRRYVRALSEVALLGRLAARARLDLLHSVAMTGPLRPHVAHVVTLGDLIWWHHPETVDRATRVAWRALVPPVARRADRLLTFSEASRKDIVGALRVPRDRIDVVPLGPGGGGVVTPTPEAELRLRLGLEGRIVLSVSAKRPHKNLVRLVQAMLEVRRRAPDAILVVTGNPTEHEADLRREASAAGVSEAVHLLDYVSDEDLEGLYQVAECFVFPSLREGFGLPLLEAMQRGVPVACSSTSSLPEVTGPAARYFDPERVDEIAESVAELLENRELASQLAAAGHERQQLFTWRRAAEGTLESYQRAWAESRRRLQPTA
jgi:glycosyltransferase involved in cell wall biosynthesis